jgi:hypothetical protein
LGSRFGVSGRPKIALFLLNEERDPKRATRSISGRGICRLCSIFGTDSTSPTQAPPQHHDLKREDPPRRRSEEVPYDSAVSLPPRHETDHEDDGTEPPGPSGEIGVLASSEHRNCRMIRFGFQETSQRRRLGLQPPRGWPQATRGPFLPLMTDQSGRWHMVTRHGPAVRVSVTASTSTLSSPCCLGVSVSADAPVTRWR